MRRVAALVELRLKTLLRGSRGPAGTLGRVVSAVMGLLVAGLSLAMAAGFGSLVHYAADSGDEQTLRVSLFVAFYTFFFFGLVLPFVTSTLQQALDVSPLRVFPLGRLRLFAIQLVAAFGASEHLFYYPSLAAVLWLGALQPGLPWLGASLLVLMLLVFFGVWGNAVNLWLGGLMRRRLWREVLGIAVLGVVIVFSFLPVLLDREDEAAQERAFPWVERSLPTVIAVSSALPPSLAGDGLVALHRGDRASAWRALGWLVLWNLAGLAAGYLAFVRFHLGDPARVRRRARARTRAEAGPTRTFFDLPLLARLPAETRAVAAKDLHYLFRSTVGKFALVVLPVFVAIVSMVFLERVEQPVLGMEPERLVLFALLFYTTLFSNNLLANAYAWEGEGAKLYFASPARLAPVIAGKNLAIWLFNLLLLALTLVTWSLLVAPPAPLTLATGLLIYAAVLLALTTSGNLLSVHFPVRRSMTGMNSSPSQIAIVVTLLTMVAVALLMTGFLALPVLAGLDALQPVALLALLSLQAVAYRGVLLLSARQLATRRDRFLAAMRSER